MHAAADRFIVGDAQTAEDLVDVFLDRSLRDAEVARDGQVAATCRHDGEDLALAGRERLERRTRTGPVNQQTVHQLRIDAALAVPRYVRDRDFWSNSEEGDWEIRPGEIVAWIFINEDKGERGRE